MDRTLPRTVGVCRSKMDRVVKYLAYLQGRQVHYRILLIVASSILTGVVSSAFWGLICGIVLGVTSLLTRVSLATRIAVSVGVVVYALNFLNTDYFERGLDSSSHLLYLNHLYMRLAAPAGSDCIVCHHPALYHTVAGLWYWMLGSTGVMSPESGAQFFAIPCMIAFSLAGGAVLERFTKSSRLVALGTSLCVFWPYSIIMSARLHNDVLAAALMAWTIYACVRFYETPTKKWLLVGLTLALASVLTKMSGVLSLVSVCVVVGLGVVKSLQFKPYQPRPHMLNKNVVRQFLAICIVSCVFVAGYVVFRDASRCRPNESGVCSVDQRAPSVSSRILGSATSVFEHQSLQSELWSYFSMDVRELVSAPYAVTIRGGEGEDLFWNHFLKSAQFSTYNHFPDGETSYPVNKRLAQIMTVLLLVLVVVTGVGGATQVKRVVDEYAAVAVCFMILIVGAVAFRMLEPTSHHADFRHVYAVLVPSVTFLVLAIDGLRRKWKRLAVLFEVLVGMYCLMSVVYFIPKATWFVEKVEESIVSRGWENLACETSSGVKNGIELSWEQKLLVQRGTPAPFGHVELKLSPPGSYTVVLRGTKGSMSVDLLRNADNLDDGVVKIYGPETDSLGDLKSLLIRPLAVGLKYAVHCVRLVEASAPQSS